LALTSLIADKEAIVRRGEHKPELQMEVYLPRLTTECLPNTTSVITPLGQSPQCIQSAGSSNHPVKAPDPRLHSLLTHDSVKDPIDAEAGKYRVRLAHTVEDRDSACRLRFRVFNIEMGEGLESSYETGLDTDQFDLFCEHLLVEEKSTQRIVGTYRMQSGETAARHLGYYSEQEFCLAPYEPFRSGILELGRASIDREHRAPEVLTLLWRGIAQYANDMGLRYLIGCSSLNSQDPSEGWQVYHQLAQYRVSSEFATEPTVAYACPSEQTGFNAESSLRPSESSLPTLPKVPRLLRTYLAIGARICAPPAWDREFGTIDFLTLLDLKMLSPSARNHFLAA
jgi:putative hemolysin